MSDTARKRARHRVLMLQIARNCVAHATQSTRAAAEQIEGLDPCFETLRADLRRIGAELEARDRELITYASAACTIESVQ